MVVVGLCGCTASGKSTLMHKLQQVVAVTLISCDDFYLPRNRCPRFDLRRLPWPGGVTPPAFVKRGDADLNVPSAVDWSSVIDTMETAKREVTLDQAAVVVDGLLLFGNHPGAQHALSLCDYAAVLWADSTAESELCRRKYSRSHLGKPSYQERGVHAEDYAVYWKNYVWPAWIEHGESRVPADALRIDCMQPVSKQVDALLATGWF